MLEVDWKEIKVILALFSSFRLEHNQWNWLLLRACQSESTLKHSYQPFLSLKKVLTSGLYNKPHG